MKNLLLSLCLLLLIKVYSQTTLQEKLGYPKNTKLLILHADDLGVSHSENAASEYALEHGPVSSSSIMVPCPWFPEIAAYAQAHLQIDFGLHLTLTSEWKYLKWAPVAGRQSVPGLANNNGFMFSAVDSVISSAKASEVETELRAQIERAIQFGVPFTHFDSHMGTLYANDAFLQVAIKLAREYKVPLMLNRQIIILNHDSAATAGDVLIDSIHVENPSDFKAGAAAFYTKLLTSMPPGVHLIILHAAYDDAEMQAVKVDHPDYGAAWRLADFNFFTSETCKKTLHDNNIKVITWREIRDKLIK